MSEKMRESIITVYKNDNVWKALVSCEKTKGVIKDIELDPKITGQVTEFAGYVKKMQEETIISRKDDGPYSVVLSKNEDGSIHLYQTENAGLTSCFPGATVVNSKIAKMASEILEYILDCKSLKGCADQYSR